VYVAQTAQDAAAEIAFHHCLRRARFLPDGRISNFFTTENHRCCSAVSGLFFTPPVNKFESNAARGKKNRELGAPGLGCTPYGALRWLPLLALLILLVLARLIALLTTLLALLILLVLARLIALLALLVLLALAWLVTLLATLLRLAFLLVALLVLLLLIALLALLALVLLLVHSILRKLTDTAG
jgi:hypothetical protein